MEHGPYTPVRPPPNFKLLLGLKLAPNNQGSRLRHGFLTEPLERGPEAKSMTARTSRKQFLELSSLLLAHGGWTRPGEGAIRAPAATANPQFSFTCCEL